jgi:hypothetical protein
MKKHARRLTLNRETLLRLDETTLRNLKGGAVAHDPVPLSQEAGCMSPLCMPTYWKTCDPNTLA